MSDYGKMGDGFWALIKASFWLLILTVPLALWKCVDIAIWLIKHLEVSWK